MTSLRVCFPGEPGSFAEDAALVYFGGSASIQRLPGFREVVEAVASGAVDQGIVPIENVVFGTVQQVQDLLAAAEVTIVGEVIVPVRLCLAALPGQRLEDIERVYSHIQALGQAEAFLRTRDWSLLAATNTAGAGKMIADRHETGSAAVLSPRAAGLFGLEVLAADIQSEPRNRTDSWCWQARTPSGQPQGAMAQRRCTPRSSCRCAMSRAPWSVSWACSRSTA